METSYSVRYFVSYCLCKHFFDSNSPQTPSNVISLTILLTLSPFTLFEPKSKLVLKVALLGNWFSELFTQVEMWSSESGPHFTNQVKQLQIFGKLTT